jgi:cellulose synthase/poly-beta-1,6-N-acetylglucosamine synthase-like glycosyltransferase
VSAIVPARDAAATIGRTLAALAAQEIGAPYEVIVVDDGSTDDTVAIAERAGGRVIRGPGAGPGDARNLGVAEAAGELLAFTDADCMPAPGWLAAGVAALSEADLVQGAVEPEPGVEMGPFDRSLWVRSESGLYESANLLVRRELFERLGGFEEWIEPVAGKSIGEDTWFGWRARRAGARTAFEPRALVHHAVLPRGPAGYVGERRRLEHFPELVERVPELRDTLLWRRRFLSARSAAFDAALAGAALAAGGALAAAPALGATRMRRAPRALALALTLPYAVTIARRSLQSGRRAPLVAAVEVAADAAGLAALARGSLRHRTLVL